MSACERVYMYASTQTNCPRPISHPKEKIERHPQSKVWLSAKLMQLTQTKSQACPSEKSLSPPHPSVFFLYFSGNKVFPPAATRTLLVISCPAASFLFYLIKKSFFNVLYFIQFVQIYLMSISSLHQRKRERSRVPVVQVQGERVNGKLKKGRHNSF